MVWSLNRLFYFLRGAGWGSITTIRQPGIVGIDFAQNGHEKVQEVDNNGSRYLENCTGLVRLITGHVGIFLEVSFVRLASPYLHGRRRTVAENPVCGSLCNFTYNLPYSPLSPNKQLATIYTLRACKLRLNRMQSATP